MLARQLMRRAESGLNAIFKKVSANAKIRSDRARSKFSICTANLACSRGIWPSATRVVILQLRR